MKKTYINEMQAEDLEQLLTQYSGQCQEIIAKMGKHKSTLQDLPVVPPTLANYILLILKNVRYRPQYINYNGELLDDMLSNAQYHIISCLRYYDKSKAGKTGAFGYISGNCIQSFNYTLLKFKREQEDCPIDTDLAIIMDDESPVVKYIDNDLENIQVDSKYKKYLKAEQLPQIPLHVEQRILIEADVAGYKHKAKTLGLSFEEYLTGVRSGTIKKSRMIKVPELHNTMWRTTYDPKAPKVYTRRGKRATKRLETLEGNLTQLDVPVTPEAPNSKTIVASAKTIF